jgi:hypothetical protein
MMRPTQSSSSKTTDKVPTTPPRKPNAAAHAHIKKAVPKQGSKSEEKPGTKDGLTAAAGAAESEQAEPNAYTEGEVALLPRKTTTTDEATKASRNMEDQSPPPSETEPAVDLSANDATPASEQQEGAEAANCVAVRAPDATAEISAVNNIGPVVEPATAGDEAVEAAKEAHGQVASYAEDFDEKSMPKVNGIYHRADAGAEKAAGGLSSAS